MKLPNGYGSVSKMTGRRRKPYVVRKTAGWEYDPAKDKMVQKYEIIGYAETKKEGLQMLSDYNADPYDLKAAKSTFKEVYEAWSKEKYLTVKKSSVQSYKSSFASCHELHNRIFADLKLADLQNVIDTCGKNYPMLSAMAVLFNQMYDYAIQHDICRRRYAVNILKHKDKNPKKRTRTRISNDHIKRLWDNSADPYCQIVLMLIYNGCRINEFLSLKKTEVNLKEQWFDILLSKTENGVRRVPIADNVLPFYRDWYNRYPDCEYLLATTKGKPLVYHHYFDLCWMPLMHKLDMEIYTPHYTRHTTASLMADAGINPTVQKKILGHSGAMTLTERVYTHLDIQTLLDAVNAICVVPA